MEKEFAKMLIQLFAEEEYRYDEGTPGRDRTAYRNNA